MAYLGRPGATAPLTSADIPDNSITAAKIVADTIAAGDIGNDAVGTAELANDVVISTSGAITTTGGMTVDGATVFNEASADVDFRIEGNSDANLFYADAGNDRVGIGTATPAKQLEVSAAIPTIRLNSTEGNVGNTDILGEISWKSADAGRSGDPISYIRSVSANATGTTTDLTFGTYYEAHDATERMRINYDGAVLIGKTTVGGAEGIQLEGGGLVYAICSGARPAIFGRNDSDGTLVECLRSGSTVGSISVTTSSTAYNTSSDYRLKENVVPMSGSIDRLKTLKPSRFNFIADADTTVDGFIAHEASEVVPEAVIGEKDEMTEAVLYTESDELPEGKKIGDIKKESEPLMQGIDQSKLVPLLVGALQEAVIKIETLETENTALKTRMDDLEAMVTALEPADE